ADRRFRRAIELDPGSYMTHLSYYTLLSAMGRDTEAIAEAKRALELNPLSLLAQAAAARPYYMARRYPEAIAQAQRALKDDSTFTRAHFWLGLALEQSGRLPEAVREFEAAIKWAGTDSIPVYLAALGHAYAVAGQRDQAEQLIEALKSRPYVSPVDIATVYTGLGERDRAFEWLERGLSGRAYGLVFVATDPRFEPLRGDLRFTALVR